MEMALWRYFATHRHWGADFEQIAEEVPSVFKSRIKKMLNMDRIPGLMPWEDLPDDRWIFYDQPQRGLGSEEHFSTLHVFLMGLALDLLNIGFKQSEVIYFLKHTRPTIGAAFDQIHRKKGWIAPVSDGSRQHPPHKHYPHAEPLWLGEGKAPLADFTVWMLVRRFETKEVFSGIKGKLKGQKLPLFMDPKFVFGLEAVKEEIFTRLNDYRHLVQIELADLALTIPRYLAAAPQIGRGRPLEGSKRRASKKSRS